MKNYQRIDCLERALCALTGAYTKPVNILGSMDEGVDIDLYEAAVALTNKLEERIKQVKELDWDADAEIMKGA